MQKPYYTKFDFPNSMAVAIKKAILKQTIRAFFLDENDLDSWIISRDDVWNFIMTLQVNDYNWAEKHASKIEAELNKLELMEKI